MSSSVSSVLKLRVFSNAIEFYKLANKAFSGVRDMGRFAFRVDGY